MGARKFHLTLDARMINHSGIGTNIKSMIPGLVENYNLSILGNFHLFGSFPWLKETTIIDMGNPIYTLKEQIELPIKIPDCDLFISPHYNIPLRKIKARKRVVIINDVNHLVYANQLPLHKRIYAKYMLNAAIRKSDKVLTLSEFSKNEITKYVNAEGKEIRILYCGLDGDAVKHQLNFQSIEQIGKKYNLPKNYFLYVGSIKPHKNLLLAVKAFNHWNSKYHGNKKLVLIGVKQNELNESHMFSNLIDMTNTVIPGYIKDHDLPLIYNNAECLIFPSLYEGFGLPPLEAMICGCPVLTSNSASLPEVCGDAALYFDPFDFQELAEKMELISKNINLRREMIEKGYANVLRFTREKFTENLKREIDEMLVT